MMRGVLRGRFVLGPTGTTASLTAMLCRAGEEVGSAADSGRRASIHPGGAASGDGTATNSSGSRPWRRTRERGRERDGEMEQVSEERAGGGPP